VRTNVTKNASALLVTKSEKGNVEIRVLLPRRFNLFIRGTLIAATTARGSWRSYFTVSVERAFLL